MSKLIEEGCRAVIVGSVNGNNGVIVTVGKYIGDNPRAAGVDFWEVDKDIKYTITTERSLPECSLRRIDDNEEELSSWEAVEKTIGFVPNKQTVTQ